MQAKVEQSLVRLRLIQAINKPRDNLLRLLGSDKFYVDENFILTEWDGMIYCYELSTGRLVPVFDLDPQPLILDESDLRFEIEEPRFLPENHGGI